jgi:hypothetical protein
MHNAVASLDLYTTPHIIMHSARMHTLCAAVAVIKHTWGSRRAGWPTRTSLTLGAAAARRSTRLSTAMLDAAAASTRLPRATSCRITSTTAVVLPVPAGLGSKRHNHTVVCHHAFMCRSHSRNNIATLHYKVQLLSVKTTLSVITFCIMSC